MSSSAKTSRRASPPVGTWRFRVAVTQHGSWFWELFNPAMTLCVRSPRSYPSPAEARAAAEQARAGIGAAPVEVGEFASV